MSSRVKPTSYTDYQCANCGYIITFDFKQDRKVICASCKHKVPCNSATEVRSVDVATGAVTEVIK